MAARTYATYDEYLSHQSSKLAMKNLDAYDVKLESALTDRLQSLDVSAASVLCLAARLGGEVRAFKNLGAFAIGVDVNPGAENRHVIVGDFHDLQFPDASARFVFTNSLDHALDLDRLLREVRRVLAVDGTFIVEAMAGRDEGGRFQEWEATSWDRLDQLTERIAASGFSVRYQEVFEFPWKGSHIRFQKF